MPTQYEKLLGQLKAAIEEHGEVPPDAKRRIIQALVQEVRVTRSGFRLKFFVGVDQIKAGEALASPAESLRKKNYVPSSLFQLNGGPGRNRTGDTRLFRALLYRLSYRATHTAECDVVRGLWSYAIRSENATCEMIRLTLFSSIEFLSVVTLFSRWRQRG